MNLNNVIARMPLWYAARKCVYLKSAPGRGKTTAILKAPALLSASTGKNIGIVVINGGLLNPPDSIGYLIPKRVSGKDREGNVVEHTESIYTDPFWFRTREGKRLDEYDGGVIFVDEADKMDVDVKKVIGEAALSGRLGPHKLPEGWIIWMAGNRQSDRSGSTKELDHLINRRMEIDITDDLESWNVFANEYGVTPLTKAFANQNPHIVFESKLPDKQGPYCTPRSLVEADDYTKQLPRDSNGYLVDTEEMNNLALEEISGMIGSAAAAQLFAFTRIERDLPSFDEVVSNPNSCKVPSAPDAQMLISFNLAHRVDVNTADQVCAYMERLPKEFGPLFGRTAAARNPKIIGTKGMQTWIKNNASMMAAIRV